MVRIAIYLLFTLLPPIYTFFYNSSKLHLFEECLTLPVVWFFSWWKIFQPSYKTIKTVQIPEKLQKCSHLCRQDLGRTSVLKIMSNSHADANWVGAKLHNFASGKHCFITMIGGKEQIFSDKKLQDLKITDLFRLQAIWVPLFHLFMDCFQFALD